MKQYRNKAFLVSVVIVFASMVGACTAALQPETENTSPVTTEQGDDAAAASIPSSMQKATKPVPVPSPATIEPAPSSASVQKAIKPVPSPASVQKVIKPVPSPVPVQKATKPVPSPAPVQKATKPVPSPTQAANLPACVGSDCDCKDFATQAQAQRVFDAYPGDPFKLDRDKDGIACEKN
jgi:type IV secretory pathway VirB10-like protein